MRCVGHGKIMTCNAVGGGGEVLCGCGVWHAAEVLGVGGVVAVGVNGGGKRRVAAAGDGAMVHDDGFIHRKVCKDASVVRDEYECYLRMCCVQLCERL